MTMPFPRPPAHAVSLDAVWTATFAAAMVRLQHDHAAEGRGWAVDDAMLDGMAEEAQTIADLTMAALERLRARERGDGA